VHESADADQVVPSAIATAARLAAKDRRTVAEHKRLLYCDVIAGLLEV